MAQAKSKEIQVQKPAQSLEAFKSKVNRADELDTGILKQIGLGIAAVVVLVAGWWAFSAWQHTRVEKHEAALAELVAEVEGTPFQPTAPEALEAKMREKLPALEALAAKAPGRCEEVTKALVATWKFQLEGKATPAPAAKEPIAIVREAQRLVALGQGKPAMDTLRPILKKADPDAPWAMTYWTTLMDAHKLLGDREQAWKDLADFKQRFKDQPEAQALEQALAAI